MKMQSHWSLFLFLILLCCRYSSGTESQIEYEVEDILIETSDGASVSGIVVRKKGDRSPKPVIFQFTIYVQDEDRTIESLKHSVDKGYVAVIAYTRGKRHSTDEIWPYESDGSDARAVIDWISKQHWCNGKVGMFGGSYGGFTQWAATKKLHPALKTIVPNVANRPGMGLPMENNVFINPNYEWSFYVGSNRSLDTLAGNDRQRFRDMQNAWWQSGVAYSKMDSVDGTPNRLFQKWISHPAFDEYWQEMAPYQDDFAQIDIPILTIDGYFNDSQNSSLYYLREHLKYNPEAEHYLVIGPYDHFGAQYQGSPVVNGYTVDSDALIDTREIIYQWFDYVLKDGTKPAILKDKINYQVMGTNRWSSAASLSEISNSSLKLFLSTNGTERINTLSTESAKDIHVFEQSINFADRSTMTNDYYPDPLVRDGPDLSSGFVFVSEPFSDPVQVNGSFSGELKVRINKKDFDFGITLYEVMPNGKYFNMSHIVGRASYAADFTTRNLLTPNKVERIPFSNTRLISKQLQRGSRLALYINVNKNSFSELNYGTGQVVAMESIVDAGKALEVDWLSNSFIEVPLMYP